MLPPQLIGAAAQVEEEDGMKLCYQVATPDVKPDISVTAFQGPMERSFSFLSELGYDGVELMTVDPKSLDWHKIKQLSDQNGLPIVLVCTGEMYGQLRLSFTNLELSERQRAIERMKDAIDFASFLGANVNIGRIRGDYTTAVSNEYINRWAFEVFRNLSEYAAKRNVCIVLEPVASFESSFVNTVEDAVNIIREVGNPVFRLMSDIFTLNIEEKDMYETIQKYKAYNAHVHLTDSNRRYPGMGCMDFDKVIQAFHDTGYDGVFCVEILQLPDQETASRRSIEHLAPIFKKVYGRNCP